MTSDTFFSFSLAQTSLSCDLLAVPVGVGGREWNMNSAERPFVLRGSHILCMGHSHLDRLMCVGTHACTQMASLTENDDGTRAATDKYGTGSNYDLVYVLM